MSNKRKILIALAAVVILDVLAAILVPPFPKGGVQGDPFAFPADGITANLELPAPHVVWDLAPGDPTSGIVQFHPSITSSILTQWIVIAVILTVMILATRGMRQVPGRAQNLVEFAYESLQDFAVSLGGKPAIRYVPIFAAFFLYIIFSNWSGLVPPVGKLEILRAPTSDVNVTIGLALVSFIFFEVEGFRALGVRGYLSKFVPIGEFRNGVGAGRHRHVRGACRAPPRVRQASHVEHATLRQHLRRRGGAGRHDRPDRGHHPGRHGGPRGPPERRPRP